MSSSSMDWEQIVRENAREMLRLALRIVASAADAEGYRTAGMAAKERMDRKESLCAACVRLRFRRRQPEGFSSRRLSGSGRVTYQPSVNRP